MNIHDQRRIKLAIDYRIQDLIDKYGHGMPGEIELPGARWLPGTRWLEEGDEDECSEYRDLVSIRTRLRDNIDAGEELHTGAEMFGKDDVIDDLLEALEAETERARDSGHHGSV